MSGRTNFTCTPKLTYFHQNMSVSNLIYWITISKGLGLTLTTQKQKGRIRWKIKMIIQIRFLVCISECNDILVWLIAFSFLKGSINCYENVITGSNIPTKVINSLFSGTIWKCFHKKVPRNPPLFEVWTDFATFYSQGNLGISYTAGKEMLCRFEKTPCRSDYIIPQNSICFLNFLDGLLTKFLLSPVIILEK